MTRSLIRRRGRREPLRRIKRMVPWKKEFGSQVDSSVEWYMPYATDHWNTSWFQRNEIIDQRCLSAVIHHSVLLKTWSVVKCPFIRHIHQTWPSNSNGHGQVAHLGFPPYLSILSSWVHGHLNILPCNNWWYTDLATFSYLDRLRAHVDPFEEDEQGCILHPIRYLSVHVTNTYSTRRLHCHFCGLL